MSSEVKISRPKLRLVVEIGGTLIEYTVQTDNRDAVQFDLMRSRKGWPDAEAAPMLWMSVCGYTAMKRSGELPDGCKVDEFLTDVLVDVVAVDDDGNPIKAGGAGELPGESEAAAPFPPAAALT